MHRITHSYKVVFCSILILTGTAGSVHAQLNTTFEDLFDQLLEVVSTVGIPFRGSFDNAAERANLSLTPAFNTLIDSNVASFPLTSTIPLILFDPSAGAQSVEGQGPVFAEIAETIGRGNISIGFNRARYDMEAFRGLKIDDFRFTLTTDDVNDNGILGDLIAETETLDIHPNLNLSAETYVFYLTVGVLDNLDLGAAFPFIKLRLNGTARAVINSTSLFEGGLALNIFNDDPFNPVLEKTLRYDESATGLGDIAFRMKYVCCSLGKTKKEQQEEKTPWDVATLLEVRVPTGNKNNFFGTGDVTVQFTGILSQKRDDFWPHLNLGYEYRGAKFDSDEIEFNVGFSQKISDVVTIIVEVMGEYDVEEEELTDPLLESDTIHAVVRTSTATARATFEVPRSNLPHRDRDNVLNLSLGCKIAPLFRLPSGDWPSYRFSLMGNVFVPLQDGGLRSQVVPTLGLAINF